MAETRLVSTSAVRLERDDLVVDVQLGDMDGAAEVTFFVVTAPADRDVTFRGADWSKDRATWLFARRNRAGQWFDDDDDGDDDEDDRAGLRDGDLQELRDLLDDCTSLQRSEDQLGALRRAIARLEATP